MTSSLVTIAPYKSIAEKVAGMLADGRGASDPLAAWPGEVIVASHGVAEAIAAAMLERFPRGFAALQLQSIDTFARRVLNSAGEFPRVASEVERRLAMRTAARAIDDPLTSMRGAAAMLDRSYRDIRDSGITLAEFSDRVTKARSLRNRDRVRLALRAWQLYEKLIAQLGAVDPADVLIRAADLIAAGTAVTPQIVAGFYDMTGAQLGVVRALRAVEKVDAEFVPAVECGGHAAALTPIAAARPPHSRSAGTREDEIRSVCDEISALIAQGETSIGIVARSLDPYDIALFHRFAGFALSEAIPAPLAAHRFARAIVTLLRLRERNYPRSEVLEIARSGLKLASRVDAEKIDYETRKATVAGGRSSDLRRRKFRSASIDDYIVLVDELESLTEKIDASWLQKIIDRFRVETEQDLATIEALQQIADVFQRAEGWKRPFDTNSLIDAIENGEQPRPASREPRTVWVGDVMRLRGRTFQHLFGVRMQDDRLPQRRNEDPLLPDSDRRSLGLREIGDGRDEEQLLFGLMCDAGENVAFSYAASDGFGKPLRKSHYLRGLSVGGSRLLAKRPTTSNQRLKRQLQLLTRAGTNSVFDGYIDSAIVRERAQAALQSMSPTHLEDFGECPQKFLLKTILGARDLDDPEMQMQIDHREKGNVDHKILERFYRETSEATLREAMNALPVLPEHVIATLDRIIDEEFASLEERIPPFNAPVRKIEHDATRRVLREFVARDLTELNAESLLPRKFEHLFGPFVLDIDGTALRIEGKIDRIDEGDGRSRIIDYKSGKALRHAKLGEKIDRGVRLQLALYALAMNAQSGAIKPIAGTGKLSDFSFTLEEKETRLRETLALFVHAIRRGEYFAFPNEKDADYNACKYCPVNHSCRTRHDAEEKRAALRVPDPRSVLEGRA